MTNSRGGWSLPGIRCRSNGTSEFAEGKERNWPIKISITGFTTYNNSVVEAQAPAQDVVDKRGSLR
jgi:hypothetical protein